MSEPIHPEPVDRAVILALAARHRSELQRIARAGADTEAAIRKQRERLDAMLAALPEEEAAACRELYQHEMSVAVAPPPPAPVQALEPPEQLDFVTTALSGVGGVVLLLVILYLLMR